MCSKDQTLSLLAYLFFMSHSFLFSSRHWTAFQCICTLSPSPSKLSKALPLDNPQFPLVPGLVAHTVSLHWHVFLFSWISVCLHLCFYLPWLFSITTNWLTTVPTSAVDTHWIWQRLFIRLFAHVAVQFQAVLPASCSSRNYWALPYCCQSKPGNNRTGNYTGWYLIVLIM